MGALSPAVTGTNLKRRKTSYGRQRELHGNDGRRGPLLTVRETAERLRVSEKTVRRMITKNEIPVIRVGPRLIRIPEDSLMNVKVNMADSNRHYCTREPL